MKLLKRTKMRATIIDDFCVCHSPLAKRDFTHVRPPDLRI